MNSKNLLIHAAALALLAASGSALAVKVPAEPVRSADGGSGPRSMARVLTYRVPLYKSTVVSLTSPAKSVSVGNPGIADILMLRSSELYVVGKALGATNVVVWDENGRVATSFEVEVTHDLDALKEKLHELLPGEDIKVYSAQDHLVLSGEVSNLGRMDAARQLASGFLPNCVAADSDVPTTGADGKPQMARTHGVDPNCRKGELVNLLQVGGAQQVMLKITVAEMARNVVKSLDSNLNIFNVGNHFSGGGVAGGASFPNALDPQGLITPVQGNGGTVGPPVSLFQPSTAAIDATGVFLSYLRGNFFLQAVLDVSKRNGLAKILSEPTLTTLTGQEAQFVSGGEFPIPVPQGGNSNATTIEFKEFGVSVKFTPVVLDSGRINLQLKVIVSEISGDNTVALKTVGTSSTFVIPSLTKRSAQSTVELADGQSIGIAGLINDNVRSFVDRMPGLGDIPLLGALFRSQQYVSGQTELVMFVTPHLAKPIAPGQMRLPTDSFVPAEDLDFYLMGKLESRGKPGGDSTAQPRDPPGGASFGHGL
jgi:pilus assembly protein CpaC